MKLGNLSLHLSISKLSKVTTHTVSMDQMNCVTSSCRQSPCFKRKKEILQLSEENERLQNEIQQLKNVLNEANSAAKEHFE